MTAPGGSRRGPSRNSAMPSSVRGAVLIGLAVVVGIIGLQILDDSGPGSSQASVTSGTTVTTSGSSTTPTTTGKTLRPAGQVRVKVYNASGVLGVAQTMTDTLKAKGYNMQTPATLDTKRSGTAVQCRAGFANEATALAAFGIGNGAVTEPFPKDPPAGAGDADCLVIIGTT